MALGGGWLTSHKRWAPTGKKVGMTSNNSRYRVNKKNKLPIYSSAIYSSSCHFVYGPALERCVMSFWDARLQQALKLKCPFFWGWALRLWLFEFRKSGFWFQLFVNS